MPRHPNLLFVFPDQMRAHATGYAGDPNVRTPHLDRFAGESLCCENAISNVPVCCPYRASLLTGQYAHTHGMLVNDQQIRGNPVYVAEAFKAAGYDTAYIGKWHVDGQGRTAFIPRERRKGFDYWRVLECTHDYNHSLYYGDTPERRFWEGYDAIAQTRDAQRYLEERRPERPFCLFLSWGPPHNPYETAPEEYRRLYHPEELRLRPNVPEQAQAQARRELAGYYAHMTALDQCFGDLLQTLDRLKMAEDTVVVFTSDHGDMLGSHAAWRKQWPYEESIHVPLLIRQPGKLTARHTQRMIGTPDLMPTLLGLCGLPAPETVEGTDHSRALREGDDGRPEDAVPIACYVPFHEWNARHGGREYRGLRTRRHTYVRSLWGGPWLFFDNREDPYQMRNLAADPEFRPAMEDLDGRLTVALQRIGDDFLPAGEYIRRFGFRLDANGDIFVKP